MEERGGISTNAPQGPIKYVSRQREARAWGQPREGGDDCGNRFLSILSEQKQRKDEKSLGGEKKNARQNPGQ